MWAVPLFSYHAKGVKKRKVKGDHAKGVVQRTAFSPDTYGAFGPLYCSFAAIPISITNHPCHLVEGNALLSCYFASVVVVLPRGKH